jgi:hypothetical protein
VDGLGERPGVQLGPDPSAVFFGINTLDLLVSFAAVRAPVTLIIGFVIWLAGLAAIVLLFGREASAFFKQPRAQR